MKPEDTTCAGCRYLTLLDDVYEKCVFDPPIVVGWELSENRDGNKQAHPTFGFPDAIARCRRYEDMRPSTAKPRPPKNVSDF